MQRWALWSRCYTNKLGDGVQKTPYTAFSVHKIPKSRAVISDPEIDSVMRLLATPKTKGIGRLLKLTGSVSMQYLEEPVFLTITSVTALTADTATCMLDRT